MTFLEGDTFDRYVIETPLGQGGMGVVYRAYDPRLRRKIALKVLRLDDERDAGAPRAAAERLLREARAAAALDHPNAVSVFDVGEVDGTPYIAMELVQGESLRDIIGDASVPYERRVRWLVEMARALAAAHERGLVHRDVKPENVMVRNDGVVKVVDFGIAKRIKLEVKSLTEGLCGTDIVTLLPETVKGTILGTPRYLAPEQIAGDAIDGRTDQFAWGVVAYELLNGAPPWLEDAGVMQMLVAISSKDPPSLGALVPHLPPLVSAVVMRALARKPEDRFQSMSELVAALQPFESATARQSVGKLAVNGATTKQSLPHIPPPSATARRRRGGARQPWWVAAVAALVAAAVAAIVAVRTQAGRPAPAGSTTGTAAPRAAVAVTDLPPPASANAEAVASYRAAMQAFRDGTFAAMREGLLRAVTHDPAMAAGHLRLAIFGSLIESDEAEARRSYKRAAQFRGGLDAHDAALFEAVEPYFQRDPSDPAECERRMRAASERFADDAELAFFLGWIRYDLGQLTAAMEAFDRAIAIDPKFALAWSNRGGCQAYLGDVEGALRSLDRCLAISSQATESLWYREIIFEQEGDAAKAEEEARRWISKDAEDPFAYAALARALHARGRPPEAVRAALEQKWARITPERRARTEPMDRAILDVLAGDFDAAEKEALLLERVVAGEPNALAHAEPARLLVEIYRETGRDALAAQVADRYVKRSDAWQPAHRVDDGAMEADPIPDMLSALAHGGALAPSAFDAQRRAWLSAWEAKTRDAFAHYLWVYAYAVPAETPQEAHAALAALPKFEPLPTFLPQSVGLAAIGRVHQLAARADDALPYLRKATASLTAFYRPLLHTRAHLWLGDALAAKRDAPGACAAYGVVLARWGGAARSQSARAARAAMRALSCAPLNAMAPRPAPRRAPSP